MEDRYLRNSDKVSGDILSRSITGPGKHSSDYYDNSSISRGKSIVKHDIPQMDVGTFAGKQATLIG
jgi:hypothetical protein